jgi:hypothetical protein
LLDISILQFFFVIIYANIQTGTATPKEIIICPDNKSLHPLVSVPFAVLTAYTQPTVDITVGGVTLTVERPSGASPASIPNYTDYPLWQDFYIKLDPKEPIDHLHDSLVPPAFPQERNII